MNKSHVLFLLSSSLLLVSCGQNNLTNAELIHIAYLDSIEATKDKIRPLLNLNKEDNKTYWNEDKVLLFTLHRFPTSYPEKQEITFTWGESWVCSVKEYSLWAKANKDNIQDTLLRTKQLLGMAEDSPNTYISTMWFSPKDLIRPAYVTDVNKPMDIVMEEGVSDDYLAWFKSQYYYSYEVKHLPWTRLGYTYDWSNEAKDRYGLSEFVAFEGTTVTVERTYLVEDFFQDALTMK